MAYVYLLRCSDGSLYCGWTTDVQRRLAAHGAGTASRYTRSRRPVELALVIRVADRVAALRAEARIKRLPRAAKLRLIEGSGAQADREPRVARLEQPLRQRHRADPPDRGTDEQTWLEACQQDGELLTVRIAQRARPTSRLAHEREEPATF